MVNPEATGTRHDMFRIYRPANSDTTYAIRLSPQGASILDSSTGQRSFVDGNFETIHQALGKYLLMQLRVDDAYSEIMMGVFD